MRDVVPVVCFHNRPGREELTEKKDFYHSDSPSFFTRSIELICQYYRTVVTGFFFFSISINLKIHCFIK